MTLFLLLQEVYYTTSSSPPLVTTLSNDGLYFNKLIHASGHSTVRVVVFDKNQMQPLRDSLGNYGCSDELSHLPKLVAVDIPPEIELSQVMDFLAQGREQDIWDYEEANLYYKQA